MSSFSRALTTVVVCRLVVNLRKQSRQACPRNGNEGGPCLTTSGVANLTSLASIARFFDIEPGGHFSSHESMEMMP
jgi:hypothetical protein